MQVERHTLHASTAEVADGDGPAVNIRSRAGVFVLDVSAASGTTPTLDVDIEEQDPVSGAWFVVDTFAQLVAAGNERRVLTPIYGFRFRAAFVITGTTPEFTFTVSFQGKEGDEA